MKDGISHEECPSAKIILIVPEMIDIQRERAHAPHTGLRYVRSDFDSELDLSSRTLVVIPGAPSQESLVALRGGEEEEEDVEEPCNSTYFVPTCQPIADRPRVGALPCLRACKRSLMTLLCLHPFSFFLLENSPTGNSLQSIAWRLLPIPEFPCRTLTIGGGIVPLCPDLMREHSEDPLVNLGKLPL